MMTKVQALTTDVQPWRKKVQALTTDVQPWRTKVQALTTDVQPWMADVQEPHGGRWPAVHPIYFLRVRGGEMCQSLDPDQSLLEVHPH